MSWETPSTTCLLIIRMKIWIFSHSRKYFFRMRMITSRYFFLNYQLSTFIFKCLQDSFPLTKALAVTSFSECRIFLYFYYVFLYVRSKNKNKYNHIELRPKKKKKKKKKKTPYKPPPKKKKKKKKKKS